MIKKFLSCFMLLGFCINLSFATYPVFDPTNWLANIDTLYSTYDQIMNTIQMIQQNYEQMQFYLERAQNFKWQEIKWDGDLDFRNEIKQATRQVNSQLTNIRRVRDAFRVKNINLNGHSYSLKDLVGAGDDDRTIEDLVADAWKVNKNSAQKMADTFETGLTDKEGAWIWAKYGMSPANYYMVKDVNTLANEHLGFALLNLDEEVKKLREEKFNKELDNVMAMMEEEGLTEGELQQVTILLQKLSIEQLREFKDTLEQFISYIAWQRAKDDASKEAVSQSEKRRMAEYMRRIKRGNF